MTDGRDRGNGPTSTILQLPLQRKTKLVKRHLGGRLDGGVVKKVDQPPTSTPGTGTGEIPSVVTGASEHRAPMCLSEN